MLLSMARLTPDRGKDVDNTTRINTVLSAEFNTILKTFALQISSKSRPIHKTDKTSV